MKRIYINGKFLGQAVTGAQRFAFGVLLALDDVIGSRRLEGVVEYVLVYPTSAGNRLPNLKNIKRMALSGNSSHVWEQFTLPLHLVGKTLLNLSGSGPAFKLNQFITIFDAAIFDHPQAYAWRFRTWYRILFTLQSVLCRGVFTISRFSQARLSGFLRLEKKSVCVIPCGIDHMYFNAADDTIFDILPVLRQKYILVVGSMNPTKNFQRLAESFLASDIDRNIKLVVVGTANDSVFSQANIVENDRIVRATNINDRQLAALYSHALAFAFPSRYEGFGIPPLEAMYCGCPVIAANAASIPEVCGEAALYFEPDDERSIGAAIEEVVRDSSLRERLRAKGRIQSAKYSWRKSAELLHEHLLSHTYPRQTTVT